MAYLLIIGIFIKILTFSCPYDNENDCVNLFVLPNLKKWAILSLVPSFLILFVFIKIINKQVNIILTCIFFIEIYYIFVFRDTNITLLNYHGAINFLIIIFIFLMTLSLQVFKFLQYLNSLKRIRVYIMIGFLLFSIR